MNSMETRNQINNHEPPSSSTASVNQSEGNLSPLFAPTTLSPAPLSDDLPQQSVQLQEFNDLYSDLLHQSGSFTKIDQHQSITPSPIHPKQTITLEETSSYASTPCSGLNPPHSRFPFKAPKPPPISVSPNLRKLAAQPTQSLSSLLDPDSHSNPAGQQLELAESLDWDVRTGRFDGLAMRLNPGLHSSRDGGRDRWGNRWGIENHILSPVISERTEPTHTSLSSSLSRASLMESNTNQVASNLRLTQPTPPNSPRSSPRLSTQLENAHPIQQQPAGHAHHQHAMNLLSRKKIKTQITNRQRDLDIAQRQIAKRLEKQKRDQMIGRRDEIAAQLIRNPTDAKLVRDLGKLYLEFHHPNLDDRPLDSFRRAKTSQVISRSESSLKLAIHYLEQSIQLDNLDPLTWFYLAKAWSLLLAYPTENTHEREQRLSNSNLAFRKAIVISLNLTDPTHQNIQQTNRFRSAYAQHLEGMQKYKEAASILQDALELDELDVDCWWGLGRMMEYWALDTESEHVITKQERFERMQHSCQAYQKAVELEPEDSIICQSKLNAEQALEKFRLESKQEEEAKARASKAAEDLTLTTERIRGLNLSPATKKIPSGTSIKPNQITVKSSSALVLKKLVAELRDIPEFGKKPTFSSPTKPSPIPSRVINEPKTTKEPVLSIDSAVTQDESVVSNSPTSSAHAVHPNQVTNSEMNESSSSHFSPSSQATHENSNIARGLESFQLSPPMPGTPPSKKMARHSSHISPISATPSTQNLSPISTQSHDDVKMTIVSLTTVSMQPQNHEAKNPRESPDLQLNKNSNHTFHSKSYAPPSPSALPTSMMQSLSSRSSISKAPIISSPRNILTSIPISVNTVQKEGGGASIERSPQVTSSESGSASRRLSNLQSPIFNQPVDHDHARSPTLQSSRSVRINAQTLDDHPHISESNSKQFQPKDEQKGYSMIGDGSVSYSINRTTCESSNFHAPHSPQIKFQQSNALNEICYGQHQQVLANPVSNQDRSFYTHEQNGESSISHSTCNHHLDPKFDHDPQDQIAFNMHQHPHQPHAGKPTNGPDAREKFNSAPSRVVEDSWDATGQNQSESKRSPPPPQIPPRPKTICTHRTVPLNFNPIPSSSSPVFYGDLPSESSLGIRPRSSPHLDNHVGSTNSFQDINKRYQSLVHQQHVMAAKQPEQIGQIDSSFPTRSPLSDHTKKRTTSLTSPINRPINERHSTTLNFNQLHDLSPASSHQPLNNNLQHSFPGYDYSLIDSHLQSILDVDMKRKAELKEIKKQIRRTDEWAENQRKSIVEEIRRICTPVNNCSTNTKKLIHDDQNDGEDGRSSVGENNYRPKYEDVQPMIKKNSVQTGQIHLKNQFEFHHHDQPQKNRNNYHHNFMGGRFMKSEISTATNSHTRRSMSTPPELNHHQTSSHLPNLQHKQQSQPPPFEFPKETLHSNLEELKPPYTYQPLIQPHPPTGLKTDRNQPGTILLNHADEFDKLGPAGFAINGITSIIQLLHQPRRRNFP